MNTTQDALSGTGYNVYSFALIFRLPGLQYVITHRCKKHVLLLSVEKSFKDTFLHTFRNTTPIVTQEVMLRNNLYTSHA